MLDLRTVGQHARGKCVGFLSSVLLGCDVIPAAAHLTASILSGAHPTVKYDVSRILTIPFGRQPGMRDVALGSLDLLEQQGKLNILEITTRATGIGATGAAQERTWVSIADECARDRESMGCRTG